MKVLFFLRRIMFMFLESIQKSRVDFRTDLHSINLAMGEVFKRVNNKEQKKAASGEPAPGF